MAIEIIFYPVAVQSDDTWYGWKDLAEQVTKLKKVYPKAFIFAADSYKTSAELNLLMPGFTYSQNVIGQHALEFDYVNANLFELNGKDAIFLDSDPCVLTDSKDNKPVPVLNQYFESVTQLDPILITANGRIVRKFLVYYCACYRNNVL